MTPVMYLDPSGLFSWKAVLGAVAVVVAVTVICLLTAGVAGVIVGASGTLMSSLMTGAAVGGFIAGGAEIVSEGVVNSWDEFDKNQLIQSTAIGGILGGISAGAASAYRSLGSKALTLSFHMITNTLMSDTMYLYANYVNKTPVTLSGIALATESGLISGATFDSPLISSSLISFGVTMADKVQSIIDKVHSKNNNTN